jgi:hypothetical protein
MGGLRSLAAAVLLLAPTGCVYRHTTVPLDVNFHRTPIGTPGKAGHADIKHFRFRVQVMWDSNAIGDIARRHGLNTVHYADLETLSVLGVWSQYIVHVYGE